MERITPVHYSDAFILESAEEELFSSEYPVFDFLQFIRFMLLLFGFYTSVAQCCARALMILQ